MDVAGLEVAGSSETRDGGCEFEVFWVPDLIPPAASGFNFG